MSLSSCKIGIVLDVANASSPKLVKNYMDLGIIRMQRCLFYMSNTTGSAHKKYQRSYLSNSSESRAFDLPVLCIQSSR